MGKIRINKLALELNIQNDDILNALKDKGHAVKNYMSSIDNTIADEIRQFFTHAPELVSKKVTPKATKKVTKKKAPTGTKVATKKTSPKKKTSGKAAPKVEKKAEKKADKNLAPKVFPPAASPSAFPDLIWNVFEFATPRIGKSTLSFAFNTASSIPLLPVAWD